MFSPHSMQVRILFDWIWSHVALHSFVLLFVVEKIGFWLTQIVSFFIVLYDYCRECTDLVPHLPSNIFMDLHLRIECYTDLEQHRLEVSAAVKTKAQNCRFPVSPLTFSWLAGQSQCSHELFYVNILNHFYPCNQFYQPYCHFLFVCLCCFCRLCVPFYHFALSVASYLAFCVPSGTKRARHTQRHERVPTRSLAAVVCPYRILVKDVSRLGCKRNPCLPWKLLHRP